MQKTKLLAFFLLIWTGAFGQNIFNSEKVFIHTDRDTYFPGDTIWFKAYVLDAATHKESNKSGVLNVSLKNPENKLIRFHKLYLNKGITTMQIVLPKTAGLGVYSLESNTKLIEADGEDFYFKKPLKVISRIPVPEKKLITKNNRPLLEFFPEGGNLVAGLDCKIAFRFNQTDSIPKGFEGIVVDQSGKEVAYFYNGYKGMGTFFLKPDYNKSYKAIFDYGKSKKEVALPAVMQEGFVISADNVVFSEGILINIHSNKNEPEKLRIYAHQRGNELLNIPFETQNSVYKFVIGDVIVEDDGVIEILLFDQNNKILNKRLVYYQKGNKPKISFEKVKKQLIPKGKVEFDLLLKDGSAPIKNANLSVSVRDAALSKAFAAENSDMYNYIQVNSDLVQKISQLDTLLKLPKTVSKNNFDIIMLTFEGRKTSFDARPKEEIETALKFEGIVSMGDSLLKNQKVDLFIMDKASLSAQEVTSDSLGHFTVSGPWIDSVKILGMIDSNKWLTIKPVVDSTMLVLTENQVATKTTLPVTKPATTKTGTTPVKPGTTAKPGTTTAKVPVQKSVELKEVVIKGKKGLDVRNDYRRKPYNWEADKELVVVEELSKKYNSAADLIKENLSDLSESEMKLMVDGKFIPSKFIKVLKSDDIILVDLITKKEKLARFSGEDKPVIHILTQKGKNIEKVFENPKTAKWMGLGFGKNIWMPNYTKKPVPVKPDRRVTLYWNPELKTNAEGKAHIEFFNSDLSRSYYVTVSGTDSNGKIVHYEGLLK
ncbi:MAG: hypothetical protein IPO04_10330 [Cytophagaceae bacterium]|nr:hypothetical protein [Cytophagaceae bacterium]